NDGEIDSEAATVSITVTAINQAPLAQGQELTVEVDQALSIVLTATDADSEAESLTYQIASQPQHGTLSGTAPDLTYTPEEGYSGVDSFTFTVNDGEIDSEPATVSITVTAINQAPLAQGQELTVEMDQVLAIVLTATDADSEVEDLTYQIVNQPQHGTLSGTAPDLTYTPEGGYSGTDSFTFSVNDGEIDSEAATIDITVLAKLALKEDLPQLELSVEESKTVDLTSIFSGLAEQYQLKIGDTDIVSGTIDGSLLTTEGLSGGSTFILLTAVDGQGNSVSGQLAVVVVGAEGNLPPVAETDTVNLPEDSQRFPINLLANDSDADEDAIELESVDQPQNGRVEIGADGIVVYTPNENYFSRDQPDSFAYKITDGQGNTSQGLVEVFVTAVNDLPTVENQQGAGQEDEPIEMTLEAEDADEDQLTYLIVDEPFNGQLSGQAPNLVYTPDENYFGSDRFTFQVNDGTADSQLAQVEIEIESVLDPPAFVTTAAELSGEYDTGAPLNLDITVENPEDSKLSYTLAGVAEGAGARIKATKDGARLTWLPTSEFAGPQTVTVSAIAADNPPVDFSFELMIIQVNRRPLIQDIEILLAAVGEPISVLVEAEDPDKDEQIEFKVARLGKKGSLPALGAVSLSPTEDNGTLATATLDWIAEEQDQGQVVKFRIQAIDDEGAKSQTRFSIGVGDVNTAPQLTVETGDRYNVLETADSDPTGEQEGLLIIFSAIDLQEDPLKLSVKGQPKGAVFSTAEESSIGEIRWLPDQKAGDGPKGFRLYTFQLVAEEVRSDDKEPLKVTKSVRVQVKNRNTLPQLTPIEDREVKEGERLSIALSATDADDDPITFDAKGLPLGATIKDGSDGTATFEWSVPFGFDISQPVPIGILAQDPEGQLKNGVNIQSFQITVLSVNRPPQLVGQLETQTVEEGETVQFTVEFIDPDAQTNPDETIELSLQSSVDGPKLIESGQGKAVFRWETDADSGRPKAYGFRIVATDSGGESIEATLAVIVKNLNRPPEFEAVEVPTQVLEGERVVVPLLAFDPDNPQEPLEFEVRGNHPTGMVMMAGADLLIQPQVGQAGHYKLKLTVTDSDGAKARAQAALTVVGRNLAPTVEPLEPIYNGVAGDPFPITFSVVFSDPNDDSLQVQLDGDLPAGYRFEAESGNFSWQPGADQFGEYQLEFSVREVGTEDEYEIKAATQIAVLNPTGPILRNLEISGQSGYVTLSVELEVEGDGSADSVVFKMGEEALYRESQVSPGQFSYQWNTSSLGIDEVTEYKISAEAAIGQNANTISIGPVIIDNKNPEIDFTAGTVEAGTGEILDVEVQVTDNGELETVVFVFGTQQVKAIGAGETYRASFVVPIDPKAELRAAGLNFTEVEGSVEFPYFIQAIDQAGNSSRYPEGSELVARLLDKTLPLAKTNRRKVTVKQGGSVSLSGGQSTDNSGVIVAYKWDLDDSDGVDFEASEYGGKRLQFIAERSSLVTLMVSDAAGNQSTTTVEIEVIDKTPPEVPAIDQVKVSGQQVTVSGHAEPEATIVLKFSPTTPAGSKYIWQAQSTTEGEFSAVDSIAEDGLYTLTATATDLAENTSSSTPPFDVIVDTTAPRVEIRLGATKDNIETGNIRPSIPVEVFDAGGLTSIDLSLLEGSTSVSIQGGQKRSGQNQQTLLLSVLPIRDLIDGVSYTVKATATDHVGLTTESSFAFRINQALADETPPAVKILSPDREGMPVGLGQPVQLKAEIRDLESGFDLEAAPISISLKGESGQVSLKLLPLNSSDNKQLTITAYPVEQLLAGKYTLSVQATDLNNNSQSAERSFVVIVSPATVPDGGSANRLQLDDVSAASLPPEKWISTSSSTVRGQLDISVFPGGGRIEVYLNDQFRDETQLDAETGDYMVEIPLVEGENRISIIPINIIGMKGELIPIETLLVDTQKPLVESLSPSNDVTVPQVREIRAIVKDSTIITSTVSGIEVDSIRLEIDGQPTNDFTYNQNTGLLTYKPSAGVFNSSNDVSQHSILLEVADQLGNTNRTESKFQIDTEEVDEIPPVIGGIYPRSGEVINQSRLSASEPQFTLRAVAYDTGSGLAEVQIRLDGQTVETTQLAEVDEIHFTPQLLTEGEHLLTVYAKDLDGNENLVNSRFVVDTKVTSPILEEIPAILNQPSIMVTGQAETEAKVDLFVNGYPAGSGRASDFGSFTIENVNLNEGVNELYAVATDSAGNQSQRSTIATVSVDLQPPTVGNPAPSDGQRTQS
ncbi:MAG: Ig-like domain-containing protein, partial [Candidatus Poribacteria bacterium]|nr:Ig-like domain-containing protein [Candidatus Poribacteria bacterium]